MIYAIHNKHGEKVGEMYSVMCPRRWVVRALSYLPRYYGTRKDALYFLQFDVPGFTIKKVVIPTAKKRRK